MKVKEIHNILSSYGLSPNKNLGQNFLLSDAVADRIINSMDLEDSDTLLEIGPGLGAITEKIAERVKHLTVVEIDAGFVRYLEDRFAGFDNVTIIHNDFLKADINDSFSKIVSNVPYYCSSEILFKTAESYSARDIFFMVQKEFAERIVSSPGNKNYGAITVNARLHFDPEILFTAGQDDFYPPPKVKSSFMALRRKSDSDMAEEDILLFKNIVKSTFWGKRKTILKSLTDTPHLDYSRSIVNGVLSKAGFDPMLRAENLDFDDYIKLLDIFKECS